MYRTEIYHRQFQAYVGFHSKHKGKLSPVATGNWGCGAFHGDPRLKFLLQLMACSAANRNMVYYTFDDLQLCHAIHEIYTFVAANGVTIGASFRVEPIEFLSTIMFSQYKCGGCCVASRRRS